jgi:hypothetical protein
MHLANPPTELCEPLQYWDKYYNWDVNLSLAIAFVESSWRNIVSREGYDFGYYQIHAHTARIYGLHIPTLMSNIEYQTAAHIVILLDKMKHCSYLGEESWSCYHSVTPKHRHRYVKRVKKVYKILKKINPCRSVDNGEEEE